MPFYYDPILGRGRSAEEATPPSFADITGDPMDNTALAAEFDSKQNDLGFTPENVANKENSTIDTSTTKYPTVNLLKTGLDTKAAITSLPFDANSFKSTARSITAPIVSGAAYLAKVLSADTVYGIWIPAPSQVTLSDLSFNVQATGTATNARLAVYNGSVNQGIGSLVYGGGNIDITGTGVKTDAGPSDVLSASRYGYWLCILANGVVTIFGISPGDVINTLGVDVSSFLGYTHVTVPQAFGAFPSTLGGSPTFVGTMPPAIFASRCHR
jgi:hypothetical protein